MLQPQPTQSNKLILGAIILLGLAFGYMYNIYFGESYVLPQNTSAAKVSVSRLTEMIGKIKWEIANTSEFKNLEKFGESPVLPGVTGKKDIFAPVP